MISIEFDLDQLRRVEGALREAPRKAATFVRQEMQRGGKRFVRQFIKERLSGPPGIKAGKILKRSLKPRVSRRGTPLSRLRLRIRGAGKIWAIHEKGGVIRPKGARYLALPVKRTRRVMVKSGPRAGQSVSVRKGQIVLVREVRIPPRLKFGQTFERAAPDIIQRMGGAIRRAIAAAMQGRR